MITGLKLLPVCECQGGFSFSQEIIIFEMDHKLFEIIEKLQDKFGEDVTVEFNTYLCKNSEHDPLTSSFYGNTQEDSFGDPLKTIKIIQLLSSEEFKNCIEKSYKKNIAVKKYLENLDPDTRIALYWS